QDEFDGAGWGEHERAAAGIGRRHRHARTVRSLPARALRLFPAPHAPARRRRRPDARCFPASHPPRSRHRNPQYRGVHLPDRRKSVARPCAPGRHIWRRHGTLAHRSGTRGWGARPRARLGSEGRVETGHGCAWRTQRKDAAHLHPAPPGADELRRHRVFLRHLGQRSGTAHHQGARPSCQNGGPAMSDMIEQDPRHAEAFAKVSSLWDAMGIHAAEPEMVTLRQAALADARHSARNRWSLAQRVPNLWRHAMAACLTIAALGAGTYVLLKPAKEIYTTQIAERRVVTLADNSRVDVDAGSQIAVEFTKKTRLIHLTHGQAYL